MKLIISKTLLVGIGFGCLASLSSFAQVTITFDELGPQPSFFANTDPLTTQYNYLGVTFSGPGAGNGGAILDQGGNFGVPALSGNDFLAFNNNATMQNGGTPSGPETVTFATPVSNVSIFGGDGSSVDFTLNAYDSSDNLLGFDTAPNVGGQYVQLSIADAGIKSITLDSDGSTYVFDNLTFTPGASTPDSGSTLVCLGIGLIGLRRSVLARQCR